MRVARIWRTVAALVLFAGWVPGAVAAPVFTESAAATLLQSYLGALAAGDTVAAGRCWTTESRAHPGFWQSLHIEVGRLGDVGKFREALARSEAVVTGVQADSSGWRVEFDWRPKPGFADSLSALRSSMHYYVTRVDDRYVFINPVDLLTRTWRTRDQGICVFHYPPGQASPDADAAMRFMAARCREVARYLGADSTRKFDIYVVDSAPMVGELILFPPSGGYCLARRNLLISASFVNPHEFVHALSAPEGSSLVNAQMTEGVAVALGGTHSSAPEFCVVQARNFLHDSLYVPLPELVAGDEGAFFANAEVTYLEAGAWAKYLLDRYGFPKLVRWDRGCRSGAAVRTAFQEVFGATLEEMEEPWKRWLAGYDLPSVGTGIPAGAELVFSMDDAAGDDDGDGTYRYPTAPGFRRGTLDLRKVQVLRDDRNAYFRLEFAEAGRPVADDSTGHGYTPGAIIAVRRSDPPGPDRCHSLAGIAFGDDDGFDLQINVGTGVMVYDPFGRSQVTSRAIRLPDGSGCGKRVEFSLPVSFVGSPNPTWKYFVGSAILDDETLTYLRSYPEPASASDAPFTICAGKIAEPPPFMDLLLPPSRDQKALLGEVAPRVGATRVVPMMGDAEGGLH
jgi:hypothetical protein